MKNNKIFHIAEDLTIKSGGLRTMVSRLDSYLNSSSEFSSNIVTLHKESADLFHEVKSQPNLWHYSSSLKKHLENTVQVDQILHLHGVWMYPQYIANKIAMEKGLNTILTSHGMLEPFLFKDKEVKKHIYFQFILKKILQNTKIIHAITAKEKDNLFKLSRHKNIIQIPNLIDVSRTAETEKYQPEDEYLLFLGRFHKVKGIELLIHAFEKMSNKSLKLKLAGFKNEYSDYIIKLVEEKKLSNRVQFIGGCVGEEKKKLFANAKAFVNPSFSEVIGMVNLEAASQRTPVITTWNTGIEPDWNSNGGTLINPTVEELTNSLNQVAEWSNEERIDRGNTLHNFVYQQYSWEKRGILWNEAYSSL